MSSIDVVSGSSLKFDAPPRIIEDDSDHQPQLWQILNAEETAKGISLDIIYVLTPIFGDQCNNVLSGFYCTLCMVREFARDPMDTTPLHERESFSVSVCFSACRCVQWMRGMWGGNSGIKQARLVHDKSIESFIEVSANTHNASSSEASKNPFGAQPRGLRGLAHALQLPREIAGGGGFATQSNFRLSHELLEGVYKYAIAPQITKTPISTPSAASSTPRSGASAGAGSDPISLYNTHRRPPTSAFPTAARASEAAFLRSERTNDRPAGPIAGVTVSSNRKPPHPLHRHKASHPGVKAIIRDYFGKDLTDPMFRTLAAPQTTIKMSAKQSSEYLANISRAALLDYFYRSTNLTSKMNMSLAVSTRDLNSEGVVHRTHFHTIYDRHLETYLFLYRDSPLPAASDVRTMYPAALRIDQSRQQPRFHEALDSAPSQSKLLPDNSTHATPVDALSPEHEIESPEKSQENDLGQTTSRKLMSNAINMTLRQRNEARQYFAAKIDSETERLTARLNLLNETRLLRSVGDLTPLERQSITIERMKSTSLLAIPRDTNVIGGNAIHSDAFSVGKAREGITVDANSNWLHFTADKFVTVEEVLTNMSASAQEHPQPKAFTKITKDNYEELLPSLSLLPTLTPLEILSILHRLSDRGNKLILFAGDSMLREMFLHLVHRIRYGDRNHAGHHWRTRCGKHHRNFFSAPNAQQAHSSNPSNDTTFIDYCGMDGNFSDASRNDDDYRRFDDQPPFYDFFHHNDIIYSVFPDGDVMHQYLQVMGKSRNRRLDFMFRRKLEEMRDDPTFTAMHGMTRSEHDEVDMETAEDKIIEDLKSKMSGSTNGPSHRHTNLNQSPITIDESRRLNELYGAHCPIGTSASGHSPQIPFSYCYHPQRHLRPLFQLVYMWDPMTSSRVETWIESPKFKYGRSLRVRGFDIAVQVNAKPYWEVDLKRPKRLFSYLYDVASRFQFTPYPNQTHHIFLNSPIPKRQSNLYENYKNYLYTRKNAALWYIAKEIHHSRDIFHDNIQSPEDVRFLFNFTRIVEDVGQWHSEIGTKLPRFTTTPAPQNEKGIDRRLPFWPDMPSSAKSLAIFEWDKLQQLHQFSTSDLKHFACCLSHATAPHDRHPKFISKSLSYLTKAIGSWSGNRHFSDFKLSLNTDVGIDYSSTFGSNGVLSRKQLLDRYLSHERSDVVYEMKKHLALNASKKALELAIEDESLSNRRQINSLQSATSTPEKPAIGEQQLFRDLMAARSLSQPGVQSLLIRSENEESFSSWMKYNVRRQPGAVTVRRIDDELQCRNTADWAALQNILHYMANLETTY